MNELGSTGLELHSALVVGKALFDFDGQADNELTFKVPACSSMCLSDSCTLYVYVCARFQGTFYCVCLSTSGSVCVCVCESVNVLLLSLCVCVCV